MVTAVYYTLFQIRKLLDDKYLSLSWPIFCWKSFQNPAYNREQCFLATVGEVSGQEF